jgi:uncharacterized protein YkwD
MASQFGVRAACVGAPSNTQHAQARRGTRSPRHAVGGLAAVILAAGFWSVPGTSTASTSDAGSYMARLNSEREAHGVHALTMRADLTSIAQGWADHMSQTGRLKHNPNLTRAVRNWQAVGENVGDGPTIDDLDKAFWASPPHRANILDRTYTDVGIGCIRRDGRIWITVDFRDPLTPPRVRAATYHPASRILPARAPIAATRAAKRVHPVDSQQRNGWFAPLLAAITQPFTALLAEFEHVVAVPAVTPVAMSTRPGNGSESR